MAKKTSLGRQKIEIAKIKKKNHLQVTFSKRRSGLFKKASELCTLCGVEIAIIVFSPAGKAFSFGHPNVESVIHKFLNQPNGTLTEPHRSSAMRELNSELTQVTSELESERKKGEAFSDLRRAGGTQFWWEAPVEDMELVELEQLMLCLLELKKSVAVAIGLSAESMSTSTCGEMVMCGVESTATLTFGYGYGNGYGFF